MEGPNARESFEVQVEDVGEFEGLVVTRHSVVQNIDEDIPKLKKNIHFNDVEICERDSLGDSVKQRPSCGLLVLSILVGLPFSLPSLYFYSKAMSGEKIFCSIATCNPYKLVKSTKKANRAAADFKIAAGFSILAGAAFLIYFLTFFR